VLKTKLKITQFIFCSLVAFSFTGLVSVYAKTQIVDSDGDGLSDSYEEKIGTEAFLSDTDGDGLDDGFEVGKNLNKPLNHDGDKLIDARDADDDNDGLPTILESLEDTDNDNIKNYLDPDSDNDGIKDGLEAGLSGKDSDFDYIDDSFDADNLGDPDENGDGIADIVVLPDHNNDGVPDILDKNFQHGAPNKKSAGAVKLARLDNNKLLKETTKDKAKPKNKSQSKLESIAKKAEHSIPDSGNKNVKKRQQEALEITAKSTKKAEIDEITSVKLNKYTDADNDGLQDSLEKILGTNPKKRDSDGDKVSDAIEIGFDVKHPQDSDHDGIIDALDTDDDNDGILTADEDVNKDSSPINDDTDEDGVPNYLDANDDGDSKLTITEGSTKDTDNDGILDYLDKQDGVKDKPLLAKKKELPKEPEVVVLSEPGDFNSLSGQYPITAPKKEQPAKNRAINALEEAIAQNNGQLKTVLEPSKPSEGKLAPKKQVSLDYGSSNSDQGVIAWIKQLF
jgi:hypothetical protein